MPTTPSVATQTNDSGTDIGAISAWATSNDTRNEPIFNSDTGDITLAFGNLSVPNGATINGLEVEVEGQGSNFAATPEIFLNNGSANSSGIAPSAAFNKSDQTVTYGSSTELWGLSWTPTTANGVIATIDVSTISSGGLFWDFVRMVVYYTGGVTSDGTLKISSGLIQLTSGKVLL
jgi:hypothetical protein